MGQKVSLFIVATTLAYIQRILTSSSLSSLIRQSQVKTDTVIQSKQ